MGDPATDKKAGTDAATEVTDPDAPAFEASNLTVPALFLKYSFSSSVLSASSPATKLVLTGTADAVVL